MKAQAAKKRYFTGRDGLYEQLARQHEKLGADVWKDKRFLKDYFRYQQGGKKNGTLPI